MRDDENGAGAIRMEDRLAKVREYRGEFERKGRYMEWARGVNRKMAITRDDLEQLKDEERRERAGLLPPEKTVEAAPEVDGSGVIRLEGYRSDEKGVPVGVDDEEALGGALSSLSMENIKSKTAFVGAANRVVAEQTGQIPTVGLTVEGPDETGRIDKWGGDGLIDVKPIRYESIRSKKRRRAVRAFIDNWNDRSLPDSKFGVEMRANEDGKLWVRTERSGKMYTFPVWMLARVLGVSKRRYPETEVSVSGSVFEEVNRKAVEKGWRKFMNRLVIDEVRRPKIEVKLTGPWEKVGGLPTLKERKMGGEKGMRVDLDRVDRRESETRKRVSRAIDLMGMRSSKPSFEVRVPRNGVPLVEISNGDASVVVRVEDLLKAIPEVSSMGVKEQRHWSLNGWSVDATSKPEEWQRFWDSIAIKGRVKKRRNKARG